MQCPSLYFIATSLQVDIYVGRGGLWNTSRSNHPNQKSYNLSDIALEISSDISSAESVFRFPSIFTYQATTWTCSTNANDVSNAADPLFSPNRDIDKASAMERFRIAVEKTRAVESFFQAAAFQRDAPEKIVNHRKPKV